MFVQEITECTYIQLHHSRHRITAISQHERKEYNREAFIIQLSAFDRQPGCGERCHYYKLLEKYNLKRKSTTQRVKERG